MKNENKNEQINTPSLNSNKTMEYINTITKSIINQTDPDQEIESKQEEEALKLIKKARSLSKPKCCCCCFSQEKKFQEISELYFKAGEIYKSSHQWRNAGLCYENSSLIKQQKLKQSPLTCYEKAYYCFEKIDIGNDAKRIFDKMNLYLEKEGKYFQVGKNYENLAIKRENKEKYDIAIEHYLQAVKYYEKDGKHSNLKTKILIKLTELMILHNHPQAEFKVPSMLENIGNNYLKNIMTKYQAKEYFGKAVLTRLYFKDDTIEAKDYMEKYTKKDKTFEESNIYILCSDIITCVENGENDKLIFVINKYKEIYELDEYMNFILDNIIDRENQKKKIKEKENEENKEDKGDDNENNNNNNNDIVGDNNIINEENNINVNDSEKGK